MAAELAETDRVRRDLVANVSHELRTPIAALQAVLENLVDGVEPLGEGTLKAMLRQTERLGQLAAQLLDLSRLESGAVELRPRRVSLSEVVADAVAEAEPLAGAVRLEQRVEPPWLAVRAASAGRVFERFYRADRSRSAGRPGGGSGIGLAIVRWVVERHGGTVAVEPDRPSGCRIIVTLPAIETESRSPRITPRGTRRPR